MIHDLESLLVLHTLPGMTFPKLMKGRPVSKLNGCNKTSHDLPNRICSMLSEHINILYA